MRCIYIMLQMFLLWLWEMFKQHVVIKCLLRDRTIPFHQNCCLTFSTKKKKSILCVSFYFSLFLAQGTWILLFYWRRKSSFLCPFWELCFWRWNDFFSIERELHRREAYASCLYTRGGSIEFKYTAESEREKKDLKESHVMPLLSSSYLKTAKWI